MEISDAPVNWKPSKLKSTLIPQWLCCMEIMNIISLQYKTPKSETKSATFTSLFLRIHWCQFTGVREYYRSEHQIIWKYIYVLKVFENYYERRHLFVIQYLYHVMQYYVLLAIQITSFFGIFLEAHCMRFLCNGGKSVLTPKMLGKSCNVAVPTICIYLNAHSFGGENQYWV